LRDSAGEVIEPCYKEKMLESSAREMLMARNQDT